MALTPFLAANSRPEPAEALQGQPDRSQQGTYEEHVGGSTGRQEAAADQAADERSEELGAGKYPKRSTARVVVSDQREPCERQAGLEEIEAREEQHETGEYTARSRSLQRSVRAGPRESALTAMPIVEPLP